MLTQHL